MIKSIQLENWKSHENTELEFSKGTTVLIGQMGSGKTSVMDAISFALFGTFPALNARKLKLDDCIMDKPDKKGSASIKLLFVFNGSEYEVVRNIERGKGTTLSEFKKNGSVVEGPNTQRVTEAIVRDLQVDYELFSRAVYSEQNQIDYFLQIPSGQRKKKIDELLKLDRFEKARATTTTVINRLKNQAKDKQGALAELEEEDVDKKLKGLGKELEELEKEGREKKTQLDIKAKELKAITDRVGKLEEKQEKARELENSMNALRGEISGHKEKMESIKTKLKGLLDKDITPKKREHEERIKRIKQELEKLGGEELQKEVSQLSSEAGSLHARLEELEKKKELGESLSKKAKELEKGGWAKKLEKAGRELKGLEEKLTQSQLAIEAEEKRLRELEKSKERCPVCDSHISAGKRGELKSKSTKAIDANRKLVKGLEKRMKKVDLSALEEKVRELESAKERLAELDVKAQLEEARKKLAKTNSFLDSKKKEQKENSEKRKQLEKDKEESSQMFVKMEKIEEMQKEHREEARYSKDKSEKLEQMRRAVKGLEFDNLELKTKRKQKEELGIAASELKAMLEASEKLREEKEQRAKELKSKQEQIKDWRKDLEFLKETAGSMDVFRNALEATQVQLREETLLALNAGTEDLWPKIYPYGDYTSLRLEIEGGDYVLQVKRRDGNWVNVEGIASGGERSTACLALRIAFSLVLTQNLSWLVLDEPTHNLDSQGISTLSTALREHLPDLVEQVFIITHEEEMEAAVSGTLYRFERRKELDEPTRAVLISTGSQ